MVDFSLLEAYVFSCLLRYAFISFSVFVLHTRPPRVRCHPVSFVYARVKHLFELSVVF